MSEDKDDKQYEASEQKLARARAEGDIPRSNEVNVFAMYLGYWLVFSAIAGFAAKQWLTLATRSMGADGWAPGTGFPLATDLGRYAGMAVIGVTLVPAVAIIAGLVAQRGLVFSVKKLKFDPKRINPVKNAAQKFGKSGLVTFAISTGKAALICVGGWYLFAGLINDLAASLLGADIQWIAGIGIILTKVMTLAVAISALFTVIDSLWKRHEYLQRQRMSRKEVEDETKSSEGDPHLKAARRKKAVDIAMKAMLADVEKASVVIVNPTHYAVALQWKQGSGKVPVCVAKGVDDVAGRIRDRAHKHKVPVYSDPPTARALHATIGIGEEIRREHFASVAVAIRFAEKMRKRVRDGW